MDDVDTLNNMFSNWQSYEVNIRDTTAAAIGLPSGWFHLRSIPQVNSGGANTVQFAIEHRTSVIYIRSVSGNVWTAWRQVFPPVYS